MASINLTQFSQIKPIYDYLKKQQENEKFFKTLEISATFVLIIFFIIFAIRPTVLTISNLLGEIKAKKLLKSELTQKINNVIIAQDLFSQVEGKYDIINDSLPDRPNYYMAIAQVKNSGGQDQVPGIINFNLEAEKSNSLNPNLQTYSVNIANRGTFNSAVDTVEKLLNNRRVINIDSIQFAMGSLNSSGSTSSATPNSNALNTNFTINFYYWPLSQ